MGLGKKLGLVKSKKQHPPTNGSVQKEANASVQSETNGSVQKESPEDQSRDSRCERRVSDAAGTEEDTKVADHFLDCVEEEDEEVVAGVAAVPNQANTLGRQGLGQPAGPPGVGHTENVAGGPRGAQDPAEPPWQLTGAWLQRAKEELHEDPVNTRADLDRLRALVLTDSRLHARLDDAFLIRFLRARKFDVAGAFRMVQRYYQMKHKHPNLFRADHTERLNTMMSFELHGVLRGRDKGGCKVLIIKIDKYDGNVLNVDDFFRLNIVALEQVVREPETQVSGIAVVVDLGGFGIQHAPFLSPYYTKNTIDVVQESFPLRFKGFHVLNQPFYFAAVYACIKPFLKEKIKRRVTLLGRRYSGLKDAMDAEYLPEEYGGPPGGFEYERWHESVLALESYFQSLESHGYPAEPEEVAPTSSVLGLLGRRQSRVSTTSAPSSRRQSQT